MRGVTQGLLCGLLLAGACGGEVAGIERSAEPLKLLTPEWNGKKTPVGQVAAVVEVYDDLLVLGDQGALVFTSGVPLASDTSQRAWRAAALLPAADLSGDWAVAVDGAGALRRLRNRSVMEGISDRYGLAGVKVRELAALAPGGSAFALESGQLAVADGQTVTRYDGDYRGLTGGGGRVAGVLGESVRVFDPRARTARDYPLAEVVGLRFEASGRLLVATRQALYREGEDGALSRVYQSLDAPIGALSAGGADAWLVIGDALALLRGDQLRVGPAGSAPAGLRLTAAAGGGAWLVSGGALRLVEEDDGGGEDQDLWRRTVLPIFTRLCATCHLPSGTSGIDLSTYALWAAKRKLMDQRVLQGKPTPMPPAGAGKLTAEEAAALRAWIGNP